MGDGKRKWSGRITSQAIVDRHSRIRRLLISYSYHGVIEIVPGCEDQCDNDDRSYRCRRGDPSDGNCCRVRGIEVKIR